VYHNPAKPEAKLIRGLPGVSRIVRQQSRGREKLLSVVSRHLQLKTDN
jgi:hypothetical protein